MRKIAVFITALLFSAVSVFAQTQVKGKVTDAKGAPLEGATVKVRGENTSTVTKADGSFEILVKAGKSIEISEVGYNAQTIKYAGSGDLTVQLTQDSKSLSEVVVTGIGSSTSRKKVAISVQSITSDKLPQTPAASIDQALVGKIAGAQITSSSGNPGSPVSIQLRGVNTIQGGSQPMIIVDGVEMGATALNSIDLNTVDRVEVVQGAAAATIYGAQGANGVIQIFTKKGKAGTAQISASSRTSWDDYINVGNVHQPLNHSFAVNANGDITQGGTSALLAQNSLGLWGNPIWQSGVNDQNNKPYKNNTAYYDHFKQLFHRAQTTNHSVSVTGGKDKMDYAISASQMKQESIIDGDLKRTNFTTNIGFEVLKNLKIRSTNQLILTESSIGNTNISSALYTYPFADFAFKDADGNSTYKFGGAGANSTNPYYFRQYRKYNDKIVDIIPSVNVNYKLPKFLELDYKYSINQSRDDYERIADNQSKNKSSAANNYFTGEGLKGGIYNQIARLTTQNSLFTAIVKFDFEKDFNLNIPLQSTTTGAYDWRKRKYNYTANRYTGLPLYASNANQADTKAVDAVYEDLFTTYGYFVNQRFDYGDYAGVSAGLRSDYSSTFGDTKKPQNFPRGDAYLRPSSFKFWDRISSWFPEFKLRGAYGEAGIQPGVFDRIVTLNNVNFDNGAAFYNQSSVSNPGLIVERSKELEFGADMTFKPSKGKWFSAANVSATVWNRKGSDVIWVVPLAISSGASQIKTNAVDLSSKGVELSLNATIYKTKNLSWDLSTVFGTSKSFTDAINGATDLPLVWGSAATYTLRPGEQIGTIYGYKAITSVEQKDPSGAFYLDQALKANFETVDGRIVDKTTKRVQFTSDKYVLGNTTPKFNMSFTNTINYKDYLSFSFQFDWIAKSLQYNQTKEWMYSEGLHGDFDNPVTINGQIGAWTAYYRSFYDAVESNGTKDFFLENSSFLRLRNISLSFDAAKMWKIPFTNKLQVVIGGRNLWTNTKYSGLDPEANQNTTGAGSTSTNQTTVQRGLDYFSFPNTKSFQIGINIGIN
jgi:TonB-dependent starch-binding outer membrane protein SusC